MAELVYAFDLKSNGEIRAGSIPAPSTTSGFFEKFLRERAFFIAERSSE